MCWLNTSSTAWTGSSTGEAPSCVSSSGDTGRRVRTEENCAYGRDERTDAARERLFIDRRAPETPARRLLQRSSGRASARASRIGAQQAPHPGLPRRAAAHPPRAARSRNRYVFVVCKRALSTMSTSNIYLSKMPHACDSRFSYIAVCAPAAGAGVCQRPPARDCGIAASAPPTHATTCSTTAREQCVARTPSLPRRATGLHVPGAVYTHHHKACA